MLYQIQDLFVYQLLLGTLNSTSSVRHPSPLICTNLHCFQEFSFKIPHISDIIQYVSDLSLVFQNTLRSIHVVTNGRIIFLCVCVCVCIYIYSISSLSIYQLMSTLSGLISFRSELIFLSGTGEVQFLFSAFVCSVLPISFAEQPTLSPLGVFGFLV